VCTPFGTLLNKAQTCSTILRCERMMMMVMAITVMMMMLQVTCHIPCRMDLSRFPSIARFACHALRFTFPSENGTHAALCNPLMHSSCSIYASSMRWHCTTGRSVRSVVIASRILLHSCLQRQRARVRGGDEPQRHRERQRGAKRDNQGLKLWRVS